MHQPFCRSWRAEGMKAWSPDLGLPTACWDFSLGRQSMKVNKPGAYLGRSWGDLAGLVSRLTHPVTLSSGTARPIRACTSVSSQLHDTPQGCFMAPWLHHSPPRLCLWLSHQPERESRVRMSCSTDSHRTWLHSTFTWQLSTTLHNWQLTWALLHEPQLGNSQARCRGICAVGTKGVHSY